MIDAQLVQKILGGYVLSPMGIHGLPHWARVLESGRKLAEETGADAEHGRRGAALAKNLIAELHLTVDQFELLDFACTFHTGGARSRSATLGTRA